MKVLDPRAAHLSDYEMMTLLQDTTQEQQRSAESAILDTSTSGVNLDAQYEAGLKSVPANLRTIQYETLAMLHQEWRPCPYQSAEAIQDFNAALKRAGFIGGRRGVQTANGGQSTANGDSEAGYDDGGADDPTPGRKRRSKAGEGSRKSRRQSEEPETGQDLAQPSFSYNPDERGPDELLPDRALTKAERLQIINHVPRSIVELHTLVEEITVRFTDLQVDELLSLCHTYLKIPPTEDEILMAKSGAQDGDDHGDDGTAAQDSAMETTAEPAANGETGNELFMGGAEESYVAEEDEDDDAWANEARNSGKDDLEGDGANDDDDDS